LVAIGLGPGFAGCIRRPVVVSCCAIQAPEARGTTGAKVQFDHFGHPITFLPGIACLKTLPQHRTPIADYALQRGHVGQRIVIPGAVYLTPTTSYDAELLGSQ